MLHSIVGVQNSGKTLYMAWLLFKEYLKGRKIYTNFDLAFPHYKMDRDYFHYISVKNIVFPNAVYGLDEFWTWCDSRRSSSNIYFSYMFNQSSKNNNDIHVTAQYNNQNDRRLRLNLHRMTVCNRAMLINNKFHKLDEEQRFLTDEENNKLYIECTEFKRVNVALIDDMHHSRTLHIPAKPIFKLYDTTQKIKR